MSTFGQLIDKAKDKDKDKIEEVMKWTLKKTKEDTITEAMIKKVEQDLNHLDYSNASTSSEYASIAGWADKYQTFINNTTKKGGKKKRKRTRKRTRKRKRKRKKQKGGVLLLGAYAAYKSFTKKNKKKRRRFKKKNTRKGGASKNHRRKSPRSHLPPRTVHNPRLAPTPQDVERHMRQRMEAERQRLLHLEAQRREERRRMEAERQRRQRMEAGRQRRQRIITNLYNNLNRLAPESARAFQQKWAVIEQRVTVRFPELESELRARIAAAQDAMAQDAIDRASAEID